MAVSAACPAGKRARRGPTVTSWTRTATSATRCQVRWACGSIEDHLQGIAGVGPHRLTCTWIHGSYVTVRVTVSQLNHGGKAGCSNLL